MACSVISRSASDTPVDDASDVQEKNLKSSSARRSSDDMPGVKLTAQEQMVAIGLPYLDIDGLDVYISESAWRYMCEHGGSLDGYQSDSEGNSEDGDEEGDQEKNGTDDESGREGPSTMATGDSLQSQKR